MKAYLATGLLALLTVFTEPGAAQSALVPGNLIIAVNEFTGSPTAPQYVAEYTPAGVRLQTFAPIPPPLGTTVVDEIRGVVVGPAGTINLFNGGFVASLATLNLNTNTWSQQTMAGLSVVGNATYGGIAQDGRYVYLPDMVTGNGGESSGVVRFDLQGGSPARFDVLGLQPLCVHYGADGRFYLINGAGSPQRNIYIFNADFTLAANVSVEAGDYRAIAALADGTFFLATLNGRIEHHAANGSLLHSASVPDNLFLTSMAIDATGRIALGASGGNLVVTDLTLSQFSRVRITDSPFGGDLFVTWVPIPEPGPVAALGFFAVCAGLWGQGRRGRRRKQMRSRA